MRRLPTSLAVIACALLCGCSYVKNRTNDLLDVFRFDVGVGPGLYAEARITDFAAVGLGYRDMKMVGLHGRVTDTTEVSSVALGPMVIGYRMTDRELAGASGHHEPIASQVLLLPTELSSCGADYALTKRGLHVADIHANVAIGYVGAEIGFSPGEVLDLLLGFVGIDIAGDDVFGRPEPEHDTPDVPPQQAR